MLFHKKEVSPTKSALKYHVLRARVAQMLELEGFNIKDSDWYFQVVRKDQMELVTTDNGEEVKFKLNTTHDLVSGRTKFFLHKSPFSGYHIGTEMNTPKYVNCRECSGRRFTVDGSISTMTDNKTLSVTPCQDCNYEYSFGKELNK